MLIYLLRHGQVEPSTAADDYNPEKRARDPRLSPLGLRQAERLGERLRGYSIERLYASDLVRAVQTAEVVCRHTGLAVTLRPELREIEMGELCTVSWEEIRALHPDFWAQWESHASDVPYPGGECGEDVRRRVMTVIEEIIALPLERVAVVTHGGVIRTLITACLGLGQQHRFRIDGPENCSISILRYDKDTGQLTVRCVNDAAHLEGMPA